MLSTLKLLLMEAPFQVEAHNPIMIGMILLLFITYLPHLYKFFKRGSKGKINGLVYHILATFFFGIIATIIGILLSNDILCSALYNECREVVWLSYAASFKPILLSTSLVITQIILAVLLLTYMDLKDQSNESS